MIDIDIMGNILKITCALCNSSEIKEDIQDIEEDIEEFIEDVAKVILETELKESID